MCLQFDKLQQRYFSFNSIAFGATFTLIHKCNTQMKGFFSSLKANKFYKEKSHL